jgi:DHA2 family multidrug resistance protein
VISTVSITYLIVWELTEKYPIVDLTLFKLRNFTIGTIAISFGYMTFFGSVVILPLWLQTQMNYTPTWAGLATAPIGFIPLVLSPIIGKVMGKIDLRIISSFGFFTFAYCSFWIAFFNTNVTVEDIALARFIQGLGVPCFFIPIISILLSGLPPDRIASAAGLSNFTRILAGSFGTSIFVTLWSNRESIHQSKLVENLTTYHPQMIEVIEKLHRLGLTDNETFAKIQAIIVNQSYMLATNDVFWACGFIFMMLFGLIWFAKPPFIAQGTAVGE